MSGLKSQATKSPDRMNSFQGLGMDLGGRQAEARKWRARRKRGREKQAAEPRAKFPDG